MNALQFDQAGDPLDVLRVRDVASPHKREGEVLIEVGLSPIHPADLAFIRGQYRLQPSVPQIAGLEGMGYTVRADDGVGIAPGTRVAFRWPGAWAKYISVPHERVTVVPENVSDECAAQLRLNVLTAMALIETCKAQRGDAIVITAATSVVANLVAQFSRLHGITTVGIIRGSVSTEAIRTSCDHVFSSDDAHLVERVREVLPSGPAALIDSVGGELTGKLLGTLRSQAHVIAYGVLDQNPIPVNNAMLIYRNLTWIGFGIDAWEREQSPEHHRKLITYACEAIARGAVGLPATRVFSLSEFAAALAYTESKGRSGKALLKP